MQIGYGTFRHPVGWANLVSLNAESRYSPRGFRESVIVEAHVQGDLCLAQGQNQYDLDALITELADALSVDGQDWGLYHDDGTPTPHYLWSDDPTSLTGNQVVYKSFPASHGGEYATGREFAYAVRNEFLDPETALLDWSDTVSIIGTTRPPVVWESDYFNAPFPTIKAKGGLVEIRHYGRAESLGTWMLPPGPLFNYPVENESERIVTKHSPQRTPQGVRKYRTSWSYVYRSNTDLLASPTVR